ncbi:MAG: COR domain-containing protein [Xenococcus sp. (in: cyanobacteria)]
MSIRQEENIPELFQQRIQEAKEKQLEELDLGNNSYENRLIKIPDEVFELNHLKVLKLDHNRISELPESLGNLTNLTSLNLSVNRLSSLPESLRNLTNLTSLNLSVNNLSSLPEFLGDLTNITELNLAANEIDFLPEALGNLTNLKILNLSVNHWSYLPTSFRNLTNLIKLNLSISKLYFLPEFIGSFSKLIKLDLSEIKISSLPEFIGNLTNLKELGLSSNQLSSLPKSLGNLTSLIELRLSGNQLSSLPESFGNLTNLTKLYLSGNKLSSLPNFLGNFANLTELDISNNKLSRLPESFGNLSNLTTLVLLENQLSSLPDSFSNLSNLDRLLFSNNQLSDLPTSITKLTNLTSLSLDNNLLSSLPESISNLTDLTLLLLRGNQLSSLPESIGNLTNLQDLYLTGNPLINPPIEVANKGIKAIREYFRQQKEVGTDRIYEAKLLIVGEPGAGKTSLAKKIKNPEYQLVENEKSTEGIDVIKWSFPLPDKELDFQVNIWDFGGQEIYHATHQFFLSKRSLYTLVADTRKENTDFYYWLNVVELLSDNSPMLIIKNEKQDRQREINETALRGQFSNLEKTLATNLATNRGLDEILTDIKHYIQKLPLVGQTLPKTWVKVRQALENDNRNYISLQEYLDICEINGFTQFKDKLQLSGYLHDLGVCLHFQDEEDYLLYKTVILQPEWGTDAVYKVLDNKEVANNKGHFTRGDLKNIWNEEKYSSMRGELLELMKKFQLCYEIPDSKDTFIAPQLLSDKQPDYDWNKSSNLILRYTYPDFMPKGIITRFIVIMHQYIDQQKYVWKTGVILNKDNTKAEVIEYYGKREIRIRVVGQNKRNFLTIVTHEIDKINESYNRLKYQKLIPCNCETCKNSQNPYAYKFKKLLERIANKQFTIQCDNPPYNQVQVLSLIDNAIDINQLISQVKQDKNKLIHFEGDNQNIIVQLGDILGDVMAGDRISKINQGNYNENINRDYIDKSRNQNFSGATIHNTGAAAFSTGDITGTVANTINQLPSFDKEPDKKELKELLNQLQSAVLEANLDEEDKEDTLEQIQLIASSLTNSQDGSVKKAAKKAMKLLRGTAAALPPSAAMVTICNQLPDLISKIF